MPSPIDQVFLFLEVLGTVAFSISGVMAAARASMDWLGGIVLAVVVSVGGGTIRDTLIGQLPVSWIEEVWPVWVAIATAIGGIVFLRLWPRSDPSQLTAVLVADAVGLSVFVVVGTSVGINAGMPWTFAVLLGVITGVGGGVIRDLLTGKRPIVLVGQIYALAGFAGGLIYVLMIEIGLPPRFAVWLPIAAVIGIRLVSIKRNWHVPLLSPRETRV